MDSGPVLGTDIGGAMLGSGSATVGRISSVGDGSMGGGGRGVFVAGGCTVGVAGTGLGSAVVVAASTRTTLVLVGARGVKALVAYWEEVIGINAASPTNVPHSSATQQSMEASFKRRHQVFSLVLPMTSTVSPDKRINTTL